jgi:beta-lactamase regulating signal transducer with metallopeptidase domain
VLRNDKMHTLNRFLLLGILVFSAVIPFLNIQLFTKEVPVQQVERIRQFISTPVFTPETTVAENVTVNQTEKFSMNPYLILYAGIILIMLTRLLISVIRVMQIIKHAQKQKIRNIVLAVVKDFIQPFTFLDKIVLSEKDFNENKDIVVAHEHAHIKQLHAVDLAVCEIFTLLHFFNPFIWLLRHDLKMIHEYQADQAVLNNGIDAQKYQLLVLKKAVGERRFALANNFAQKPILKRFKMMKKNKVNYWNGLKLILFIPLITFLLMSFNKKERNVYKDVTEEIISTSEVVQKTAKQEGFVIEIKKEGNYIDNKLCSIEDVVKSAKAWQKTGREDILLHVNETLPNSRIDEIRLALSNAHVYHVNLSAPGFDGIIYPHGDVTKGAKLTQGNWGNWFRSELKKSFDDERFKEEVKIRFGFIIDKNGKVSQAHIMEASSNAEVNAAFEKVLSQIPDWEPATKGSRKINVFYSSIFSYTPKDK